MNGHAIAKGTVCPLEKNCLIKSIVYKAKLSSDLPDYVPKSKLGYARVQEALLEPQVYLLPRTVQKTAMLCLRRFGE